MRTSGASLNDSYLVIMAVIVALIMLVVLSGGPREFLHDVESITRMVVDGVVRVVHSVGGR